MTHERTKPAASLRQLFFYVIFGVAQLGIDWAAFVALTFMGLPATPANVTSRLTAAIAGYLLNGLVTFKGSDKSQVNKKALFKYLVLWLVLTTVSTVSINLIVMHSGLYTARVAKPFVEGILAAISFVVMKLWVFR